MRRLAIKALKPEPSTELETDDIHHILSNEKRRAVIRIVALEGPISKKELIARVCEEVYGKPRHLISHDERKSIQVGLHQCHLCKLKDMSIIEDGHRFTFGPHAYELLPYLDLSVREWLRVYWNILNNRIETGNGETERSAVSL